MMCKDESTKPTSKYYFIVKASSTKEVKVELEKLSIISKISKIMNAPKDILNLKFTETSLGKADRTIGEILTRFNLNYYKWLPTETSEPVLELLQGQISAYATSLSNSTIHNLFSFHSEEPTAKIADCPSENSIQLPSFFPFLSKTYIFELKKEGLPLEALYSRKRLPDSPFVALSIKTKLWWRENLVKVSGNESLIDSLISTLPIKWEQYGGFVLLPQGSFEKEWQVPFQLLVPERYPTVKEAALDYFEKVVAPALNADHLAVKVSIPADDVLRRPKVTPLFGKHWDAAALLSPQSEKYTGSIFWAQVRQNNLHYVWSPLHTMFSAGNITEKARISSQNPIFYASDNVVVDLYCGIGYFTFPYLIHAGARLVYACEWNSWSVLGLIQGAIKNDIPFELADIHQEKYSESFQTIAKHCPSQYKAYIGLKPKYHKLVICPGNNEDYLPLFKNSAQHVNLGLIPSSIQGYPLAVQAIDETTGGFLHIHENVNDDSIERLKTEVVDKICNLFRELRPEREWLVSPQSHVEVVKSYGPHIYHVVFDFFCHPKSH